MRGGKLSLGRLRPSSAYVPPAPPPAPPPGGHGTPRPSARDRGGTQPGQPPLTCSLARVAAGSGPFPALPPHAAAHGGADRRHSASGPRRLRAAPGRAHGAGVRAGPPRLPGARDRRHCPPRTRMPGGGAGPRPCARVSWRGPGSGWRLSPPPSGTSCPGSRTAAPRRWRQVPRGGGAGRNWAWARRQGRAGPGAGVGTGGWWRCGEGFERKRGAARLGWVG